MDRAKLNGSKNVLRFNKSTVVGCRGASVLNEGYFEDFGFIFWVPLFVDSDSILNGQFLDSACVHEDVGRLDLRFFLRIEIFDWNDDEEPNQSKLATNASLHSISIIRVQAEFFEVELV
ncbi:hypothetical protein Scep_013664 [Stephania cephalantha]|uniref:Uncharacterized protein n=1 Tax=Stephania cephalantha TaxID=152367 RepID=A0AAP0J1N1_9MAGN